MCRAKWKCVGLFVAAIVVAFLCYSIVNWIRWREQSDQATGISVELRPMYQVVKLGQSPQIAVTVVNHGGQEVVLVDAGDSSTWGWRTPVIEWSRGNPGFGGCGTVSPPNADEVFTLKPGHSRRLSEWVDVPLLSSPGQYRLSVRYTNQPNKPWRGCRLEAQDLQALEMIRRSTKVSAVSNTIDIVVEE